MRLLCPRPAAAAAAWVAPYLLSTSRRSMVSLHGTTAILPSTRLSSSSRLSISENEPRPVDPSSLLSNQTLHTQQVTQLLDWFQSKDSIVVLTGAGLSTESGIPDYRGHQGSYHKGHQPMVHDQFVSHHSQRQRYWGRSLLGWRFFANREPNAGHVALTRLEGNGVQCIITQNVDRLHHRAGSQNVVELHGRTDRLVCMHCQATQDRTVFQTALERLNAEWIKEQQQPSELRADGDAELGTNDFGAIQVPGCHVCSTGFYKPDVVFFGDSVPKDRVEQCQEAVEQCDGVLVVGSSLAVHSAFRHVRAASMAGKSICIVNVGPTRAEKEGLEHVLKIEAPAGATLQALVERLEAQQSQTSS